MSLVHASSFQASVLTLPGGKDGVLPTGVLQMSIICWLLLTMVVAVIDYWLEGKNKLFFRIINVRNWRFSFNSLFCHRFPWEDLISQCLSSSHKTWPVFHSDAEWIPWKGRSLWDAQSTQHPCQPRRALAGDGKWLSLGLFCLPLKCHTTAQWWGHQTFRSSEEQLKVSNFLI